MKRYEVAKNEGLPWQVVLVTDAETDLKIIIRDCVLRGETILQVNAKVTEFIRDILDKLENEKIKETVKLSFPLFATKLYYQWLSIFGIKAAGIALLNALKAQKTAIPQKVEQTLKGLPKTRNLSVYTQGTSYAEFSDITYNRATPNQAYNLEYEKEIQRRINAIATSTAKVDYSTRYSVRASVELELRWEHNKKQIQDLKDSGVQLAWIDTHANCSERCQPWQGKLYSLNGMSGVKDGVSYQPLENATEIIDKYGYKNGCLTGFNCRHRLIPYKKGFRPITIPESVINRQREIEKQQRYMERTVRRYESLALTNKIAGRTKVYKHYKSLMDKWTERYKKYSIANKVPYYPSRLDV